MGSHWGPVWSWVSVGPRGAMRARWALHHLGSMGPRRTLMMGWHTMGPMGAWWAMGTRWTVPHGRSHVSGTRPRGSHAAGPRGSIVGRSWGSGGTTVVGPITLLVLRAGASLALGLKLEEQVEIIHQTSSKFLKKYYNPQ